MKIKTPKFGLNRHDTSSVSAYAADVARAESFGWDAAFLPDSQLRRRDTYVLLYAAAIETQEIVIGPLLTNPVTRHPSVTASRPIFSCFRIIFSISRSSITFSASKLILSRV